MSIIPAVIVLLLVALVFWGIFMLAGRIWNGVPQVVAGVILLLVFLMVALHLLGVYRIAGAYPTFMVRIG